MGSLYCNNLTAYSMSVYRENKLESPLGVHFGLDQWLSNGVDFSVLWEQGLHMLGVGLDATKCAMV